MSAVDLYGHILRQTYAVFHRGIFYPLQCQLRGVVGVRQMAKLYTLDDKLLTEVPEIRVGDKVYPVDNRQKTVQAIQRAMRRHLATHRNPRAGEKKNGFHTAEEKGSNHESEKQL